MTYSLRYQEGLEEKLGSPVLARLFKLVAQGSLKRDELEKMSFTEHMDVVTTYDQCQNDKKGVKLTLENMLDSWFENKLCLISPEESQSELLKILKAVCPPLVFGAVEELIVGKKRGKKDLEEDTRTSPGNIENTITGNNNMFTGGNNVQGNMTQNIQQNNSQNNNQNPIQHGARSLECNVWTVTAVIALLAAIAMPFYASNALMKDTSQLRAPVRSAGDYESALSQLWGEETLQQLQEFVRTGDITDPTVRTMAGKMGLLRIYNENQHKVDLVYTFALMLEHWYKEELFDLQPYEARSRLISVLIGSKASNMVVARIQKLCDSYQH